MSFFSVDQSPESYLVAEDRSEESQWMRRVETLHVISNIYIVQMFLIGAVLLLNFYCLAVLIFNKDLHSFDYYFVFMQTVTEIFGSIGLMGMLTSFSMSLENKYDACETQKSAFLVLQQLLFMPK
ncbi:uncharacterized protein LOC142351625 [Convolutriloba macropyga]|uniref:uncharacterized protein LOC142351625 n=1 Tax=Convolutriloba macropyga TaxID=536237 RepID=UPI003F51CFEF